MKLLLLNGHGINLKVEGSKLFIKNGFYSLTEKSLEYVFLPKRIDIDHVIIYGQDGNITIDAIRWLIKHNIQISILNWDGKLLTTMLPSGSVQVKTRFIQYSAYSDNTRRLFVARKFLEAKFSRTQLVLDWLKERYPAINNDLTKEYTYFRKTKTISEMMMVEGRIAAFYWKEFNKIIPNKYSFETREYQKRPWGAGDIINCMFNYGYAILEAECLKAINSSGLDVHVGFLHEMNQSKNSLAYDFQEPFRFLIDLAIISAMENNIMEKSDFIRTENYNLRLRPSGAKKLINEIDKQLTKKSLFNNQMWSWRYILSEKVIELSHYLQGKKTKLDFTTEYKIDRQDSEVIRQKILSISYEEWKKKGFSKGTLHYMKQNAKTNKPFTLNKHVEERLIKKF